MRERGILSLEWSPIPFRRRLKNIIGRHVRFDDGVFEVTFVRTPKTPLEVQEILAAIVLKEMDSKYMVSFCTANLEIFAGQVIPWTLDGEYGGNYADVVIKNHQKALLIRTWKLEKINEKKKNTFAF